MGVNVVPHACVPGVKDGGDASAGAVEALGGDLEDDLGGEGEEVAVEEALVLEGERAESTREGYDDVEVADREAAGGAGLDPALLIEGLTGLAMPVTTRVVRGGRVTAAAAALEVTAELGGAAGGEAAEDLELLLGEPGTEGVEDGTHDRAELEPRAKGSGRLVVRWARGGGRLSGELVEVGVGEEALHGRGQGALGDRQLALAKRASSLPEAGALTRSGECPCRSGVARSHRT
jgi:hypothetical protein